MTELWTGGPLYEGGGAFPITTDSVLLADFVRAKPGRAVELCSGAGLISLLLLSREPGLNLDCAEIDPAATASAERNFAANGLAGRARALCLDIREHRAALPHAAYGLAVWGKIPQNQRQGHFWAFYFYMRFKMAAAGAIFLFLPLFLYLANLLLTDY